MSETTGWRRGDAGDCTPEQPEPAGGAGEHELRDALDALVRGVSRRSTSQPRDSDLLSGAITELMTLRADLAAARRALNQEAVEGDLARQGRGQAIAERDEARRALAAAEAEVARLKEQASVLLRETTTYWEALTDLIIGAEQQSQSHADVIARASEALVAAKSVTEPGG